MRRAMLGTVSMLAVALSAGYGVAGEFAAIPPPPTEDEEARIRRELAEVHGHQERLRKAKEKRARKAAKRAEQARYNAINEGLDGALSASPARLEG